MKFKLSVFLILYSFVSAVVQAQTNFNATGSLATARSQHTATLLPNGLVLVAGGGGSGANPLASAELYNPGTENWTNTGSLANARADHTATLLPNGLVLVTGGNGISDYLTSAELYNPATGNWTTTGSLATARTYHTATLLPNGLVLVTGGNGISGRLASAELYNPATGTWTNTGSLATARFRHTATLLPNGLLLVAGGSDSSGYPGPIASAELYNPATGNWTNTGSLANARTYHTATLLPNGLVLVTGGNGISGHLASAELYNPATGTWTNTGSLATARFQHTATLLPNGLLLVAGGYGNGGSGIYVASAELYDPATGTWTTTGSLATARALHTATLLPNGLVLIAGGLYNSVILGVPLASAELYFSGFEPSPAEQTLAVGSTITAQMVNGLFTLNFTNIIGMPFCVLTTTNASLPLTSWSALGVPTELFPGYFQFTDPQLPTASQQFYRFISP